MPENSDLQLKIADCDDGPTDCQQAEKLTTEIMEAEGLSCDLSTYESGEERQG